MPFDKLLKCGESVVVSVVITEKPIIIAALIAYAHVVRIVDIRAYKLA